jgi:tetratricopeptide (TPR) repeat protein
MKVKFALLLGFGLIWASTLFAQAKASQPAQPVTAPNTGQILEQAPGAPTMGSAEGSGPMTEKEVVAELKKKDGTDQLMKDIEKRGVQFEMDADTEKRLRKAKATDDIIKAITAAGPKERAAAAKATALAGGGLALSKEEGADYHTLQSELDPDKAISLANAFALKYPSSPALSYVYSMEAVAYEDKGDAAKIVEYGEKSLALKKDNFMALMLLSYAIPQPQFINQHQADEEQQLTAADTYCQQALTVVDSLKPQPTESEADFARRKAGYTSAIHANLGMIHLDRAQLSLMGMDMDELAKAEKEYRLAVADTDHPDPAVYFRLGDSCKLQGKFDDAIAAYTKSSELAKGALKQMADQQADAMKKLKAQAAGAPAKP